MYGPMGWWFYAGRLVFGAASVLIVWWAFLDAWRRDGLVVRFAWPLTALGGVMLQAPAFFVPEKAWAESPGVVAAVAGVIGGLVVGVAAVSYFTRPHAGGGTRTRDTRDMSGTSGDRLAPDGAPHVNVPITAGPRPSTNPITATPKPPGAAPPTAEVPARAQKKADRWAKPAAAPSPASTHKGEASASPSDPTIAESTSDSPGSSPSDPTIADESDTVTVVDSNGAETLTDDDDGTLVDEPDSPTIVDEGVALESPTIIEEARPFEAELAIVGGATRRIIVSSQAGPFIVGRSPSKSGLAVDDQRASRMHFAIRTNDTGYVLEDLNSSNGTFLNGTPVQGAAVLNDGDTIEFGRTVATFRLVKR